MTQDDHDALPVNPTLAVRTDAPPEDQPAEQGDAPADLAERPASGAPTPSGEGLNAAQVSALLGGSEEQAETTRALESAEGQNPDTES
ncbi:hypothetical protein V3W47_15825 [Deinococcus sp. YIM 134068]|uniref:hypothetical protein n=1 Tax=Deinococcus lichenicola TaxID=3118910 RepID=UPI002F91D3E8